MTTEIVILSFNRSLLGWGVYLVGTAFLVGAVLLLAKYCLQLLIASICALRMRFRLMPTLLPGVLTGLGAAVMLWIFVDLVIFEPVTMVRLEPSVVSLHRRWPWQEVRIPYKSVDRVELTTVTTNVFGQPIRQSRWRKKVIVTTSSGSFVIDPGVRDDALVREVHDKLMERASGN